MTGRALLLSLVLVCACHPGQRAASRTDELTLAIGEDCFHRPRQSGRRRSVVWGNAELRPPFAHPAAVSADTVRELFADEPLRSLRPRSEQVARWLGALSPGSGICMQRAGQSEPWGALVVLRSGALAVIQYRWDAVREEGSAEVVRALALP